MVHCTDLCNFSLTKVFYSDMVPYVIGNVELHFLSLRALLTIYFLCLSTYAMKTVC